MRLLQPSSFCSANVTNKPSENFAKLQTAKRVSIPIIHDYVNCYTFDFMNCDRCLKFCFWIWGFLRFISCTWGRQLIKRYSSTLGLSHEVVLDVPRHATILGQKHHPVRGHYVSLNWHMGILETLHPPTTDFLCVLFSGVTLNANKQHDWFVLLCLFHQLHGINLAFLLELLKVHWRSIACSIN